MIVVEPPCRCRDPIWRPENARCYFCGRVVDLTRRLRIRARRRLVREVDGS